MQSRELNRLRVFLAVLLLAFTVLSVSLAAADAGHESRCTDGCCPVCFVIQAARTNLEILALASAAFRIIRHFAVYGGRAFSSVNRFHASTTLFSLKTRLND